MEQTARVSAPGVLALFLAIGIPLSERPLWLALAASAAAVLVCVLVARFRLAEWSAVATLLVASAATYVMASGEASNFGWFGLCVLTGLVSLTCALLPSLVFAALLVAGLGAQWLGDIHEPGWGTWIAGVVFTVFACVMARRQRVLLAQLQEAQAGLAERAAAEERNRIAHELHDVIGHALTVSLLHVTSARLALDEDPVEAAASLAEAERLAQQSLAEVRAVVGLMKDAGVASPLPGAAELDGLVASFARAGTTVDWSVEGDLASLTATEGLTVYRILQEALTNVARHAPDAPVTARLELARDRTRVVVDSAGAPAPVVHDGTGLTGMRQRAESLGGVFTAGPHHGGWRVEAVLPS